MNCLLQRWTDGQRDWQTDGHQTNKHTDETELKDTHMGTNSTLNSGRLLSGSEGGHVMNCLFDRRADGQTNGKPDKQAHRQNITKRYRHRHKQYLDLRQALCGC